MYICTINLPIGGGGASIGNLGISFFVIMGLIAVPYFDEPSLLPAESSKTWHYDIYKIRYDLPIHGGVFVYIKNTKIINILPDFVEVVH